MKVKLLKNVFIKGKLKKKGESVDVDDTLGRELVNWGKAEFATKEVKEK